MNLKCPIPKPIVGNALDVKPDEAYLAQIKDQEKYGRVRGSLLFSIPTIWIGDPELLKEVLVKDFTSFSNRFVFAGFGKPMDKTLVRLKDGDWKRVRSVLSSTFSASKLNSILPYINKAGKMLVEDILKAGSGTIDIWRMYGNFTMKVIFATAFGIECETQEQENKLINAAAAIFTGLAKSMPFLQFIPLSLFSRLEPLLGGNFISSMRYLTQVIENVISERRKNLRQGLPCRRDILQQLIEAGDKDKLSDDEIISQAFIFLIGGYDTTKNALAYSSYLLATNPDVQRRLIDEIEANCPDVGYIDYDTVHTLPYLDMIICETLRMYPPVVMATRAVNKNTTIRGIHFSKDAMVCLPIYGIHHDPEFWPNPEQFNPERFTPEQKRSHHPYTFIPFGGGPRQCAGMRLALLEAKVALIRILQNVELIVARETEIPLKVRGLLLTLSPVNGVKLGIRKRH